MMFTNLFSLLLVSLLAQAQTSHITLPKAGDTIQAGKNTTIQITVPVSTSQAAGWSEVGIGIGIGGCTPSGCPDPTNDLGQVIYAGYFQPLIHDTGSLNAYQNFTLFVPETVTGVASIRMMRAYINTIIYQPAHPAVEYVSTVINVAASSTTSYNIHPNNDQAKCVGLVGGVYANGTNVDIYDCNGSASQKWSWNGNALVSVDPSTKVQWCMDAGVPASMTDGTKMKIWSCFPGLTQQTWKSTTTTGQIALSASNYCLDLTNGDKTNKNILQIWSCVSGNTNQIWSFSQA